MHPRARRPRRARSGAAAAPREHTIILILVLPRPPAHACPRAATTDYLHDCLTAARLGTAFAARVIADLLEPPPSPPAQPELVVATAVALPKYCCRLYICHVDIRI
eukprot:SAG31_NODE_3057_length_4736_cov_28.760190_2_plen_106_part_00